MRKLQNLKKPSITTKLLFWFLVIALVPLIIEIFVNYQISEAAMKDSVVSNLTFVLNNKATRAETYGTVRENSLSALATMPDVNEAIQRYDTAFKNNGLKSSEYIATDNELRPILSNYAASAKYLNLFLISTSGDNIFSIKGTDQGTNFNTGPYKDSELAKSFHKAIETKLPQVSNFEYYAPTGGPAGFVTTPIIRNDTVIGVLAIQESNTEIYAVLNEYNGLGASGELIVGVGPDSNNDVTFITPVRFDDNAAFNRKVHIGSEQLVPLQDAVKPAQIAGSKTDAVFSGEAIDFRGHHVIAVWKHDTVLNWGMVVTMDIDEAYAPIYNQRNILFGVGGLMLLLVALLAIFVARTISRPIIALTRVVRLIANGDLSYRAPVTSNDEIGELSQAFNAMAENLKRIYASIEEKVAQRTDELQQRTKELQNINIQLDIARKEADSANQAKSTFLANMSHELRTPLNAIIGYSDILAEEATDAGQQSTVDDLGKIRSAGTHLLGLINDILDLSKIEAGKMTLYLESFDIHNMLGDVVSTIQPLIEKGKNKLVLDIPSDIGEMTADIMKVRQSLLNLLSNASKFSQQGTVTLSVRRTPGLAGDVITMKVSDTGIGMTEEQMGHLFQAFSQAEASTTRKFGGTGLGLAISRRFCQLMGGDITVESEVGKGSTFTITLPAHVVSEASSVKTANVS